ncbi:hypothetical protein [Bradyrhizobium prioriisuperbiae]|uniref:hypothetical protein n=1 Tax=Bradyrhizobium prioriisuperbiae TaxID=2854389 RepID=UPI0028E8C007|nr:hypothetical protein [Bradyrhizobium prioritasuperba]
MPNPAHILPHLMSGRPSLRSLAAALTLLALIPVGSAGRATDDPLSGTNLYADVEHYVSLGVHRFGTDTDRQTIDWIAAELSNAGLQTEFQTFTLGKQYFLDEGNVTLGGKTIAALPFWWPPQNQTGDKASLTLTAPLASGDTGNASGHIVWLKLPNDRSAYLSNAHRIAIKAAVARTPLAVIVTIDNPGEDIYAYNVAQDDAPWPVPVIIVASREQDALDAAQRGGTPLTIDIKGRYASDVEGRNVVARLDRGADKTIVVSTPTTGWFRGGCERGSGIAGFLAIARIFALMKPDVNFVFVATSGHEIGHGGMDVFLHRQPPAPDKTLAWIHFGASIACFEWQKIDAGWTTARAVDPRRAMITSRSLAGLTEGAFAGQPFVRVIASGPPPGELRDVHAAGYANFFGIAAGHRFFHNPADTAATTGPEVLEPVVRGFAQAIATLIERGDGVVSQEPKKP